MSGYEVRVPIRRPWLALLIALFFIPFGDFIRITALLIRGVLRPESQVELFFSALIGLPFVLICAGFTGALGYWAALNLFGVDELRLESDRLRIRKSVLGLGRWKEYPAGEITGLRVGGAEFEKELLQKTEQMLIQELARTGRMFAWAKGLMRFFGILPGIIFRWRKQTVWFGSGMDESQAREVVTRLRMQLPEGAFL